MHDSIDEATIAVYVVPVSEIQAAVRRLAIATADMIRLAPLAALNVEAYREIAERKTPLGVAVSSLVSARADLHQEVHRGLQRARDDIERVVHPFLAGLFGGASIPGVVALPSEGRISYVSETVLGLESVEEVDGEVRGIVRVAPTAAGDGDTRAFYCREGRTFFAE